MKLLYYVSIVIILSVTISFTSCKEDNGGLTGGVTGQSWQEGKALNISLAKELSVTFSAKGDWTATTDSPWCELRNNSGSSGDSTLKIWVSTTTEKSRTATIAINVKGYDAVRFQVTQQADGATVSEDEAVNALVDSYLRENYLWNDEYKTLSLDFTKSYESFLNDALMSLTTNTLDKKRNAYGEYEIFSFIEMKNSISETRSTKLVNKELEYNFGITGINAAYIGDNLYYFGVQGVYPDSPAKVAGITRGTTFKKINGENLTYDVASYYLGQLLAPSSVFTLKVTDLDDNERTITSKAMYVNPVIFKQVKEVSGHNIGYLVYDNFNAAFDVELFEVFKDFKSRNVTDLILDLRYNYGGHTMSANLMASCIAGSSAADKVFSSLRYNADRMKALNNKREDEMFMYANYPNLGTSLAGGDLGLKHIYCLVGNNTASASELVINSLRGIDVEVTLIGEKTTGKNVGMEPLAITVRRNKYRLAPITFQSYNAKGFGEYEAGFMPQEPMDETNPFGEEGAVYAPREYGTDKEYLYVKAVEMITGVSSKQKMRNAAGLSFKGKVVDMPIISRPGKNGMLRVSLE